MVRDAVERTGRTASARPEPVEGRAHAAFALLPLPRGGDADGLCIIEPSVRCTHCGFCQTYGH
jgi:hypothetical protein